MAVHSPTIGGSLLSHFLVIDFLLVSEVILEGIYPGGLIQFVEYRNMQFSGYTQFQNQGPT